MRTTELTNQPVGTIHIGSSFLDFLSVWTTTTLSKGQSFAFIKHTLPSPPFPCMSCAQTKLKKNTLAEVTMTIHYREYRTAI